MKLADIQAAYQRNYNPSLAHLFAAAECPIELRGQGSRIYDDCGKSYLDFSAGYGTLGLGHVHPDVQSAVQRHLSMPAAPIPGFRNEPAERLTRRLADLAPGDLNCVLLSGSGSEAVEIALRTALLAQPGRRKFVAAANSYHGKTLGALSVMGQDHLRRPFGHLLPEISFVRYGDAAAMSAAIDADTVAVILEPVLGGGFITVPPAGYLTQVRAQCDADGALLIVDEVQTGFGRTGKMFAVEHDGIVPDLLVVSKAIGGGHVPIAATLLRDYVVERLFDLEIDLSQFGSDSCGWPLVCAAANAALDVLVKEKLPQRAAEMGAYLKRRLYEASAPFPELVLDIPGQGLMLGAKLRNSLVESVLWAQLLKRGIVTGLSTNWVARRPVMRFFPPLVIERDEIDEAVRAFGDSLAEMQRLPRRLYDLLNQSIRFQYLIPSPLLRRAARWLSPPLPVAQEVVPFDAETA